MGLVKDNGDHLVHQPRAFRSESQASTVLTCFALQSAKELQHHIEETHSEQITNVSLCLCTCEKSDQLNYPPPSISDNLRLRLTGKNVLLRATEEYCCNFFSRVKKISGFKNKLRAKNTNKTVILTPLPSNARNAIVAVTRLISLVQYSRDDRCSEGKPVRGKKAGITPSMERNKAAGELALWRDWLAFRLRSDESELAARALPLHPYRFNSVARRHVCFPPVFAEAAVHLELCLLPPKRNRDFSSELRPHDNSKACLGVSRVCEPRDVGPCMNCLRQRTPPPPCFLAKLMLDGVCLKAGWDFFRPTHWRTSVIGGQLVAVSCATKKPEQKKLLVN